MKVPSELFTSTERNLSFELLMNEDIMNDTVSIPMWN